MISLPRGVADYLAPHPDVEIEPARRPSSGRCCFLSLADRPALAVVTSRDKHETDHGEPGNHEGNSDHCCCPFCLQGLAPKSFGRSTRTLPERSARKMVVGLGDAPSNACMSGR